MLVSGAKSTQQTIAAAFPIPSEDIGPIQDSLTASTAKNICTTITLLSIQQEGAPEKIGKTFPVFVAHKEILFTLEVPEKFNADPSWNSLSIRKNKLGMFQQAAEPKKWNLNNNEKKVTLTILFKEKNKKSKFPGKCTYEIILNRISLINELLLVTNEHEQTMLANGNPDILPKERKDILCKTSWWPTFEFENKTEQSESEPKKRKIASTTADTLPKKRINADAKSSSPSPPPALPKLTGPLSSSAINRIVSASPESSPPLPPAKFASLATAARENIVENKLNCNTLIFNQILGKLGSISNNLQLLEKRISSVEIKLISLENEISGKKLTNDTANSNNQINPQSNLRIQALLN